MKGVVTLGSRAYRFYQSDDPRESYLAAVLALLALGLAWWRVRGRWSR